jgi:hypothetical protein
MSLDSAIFSRTAGNQPHIIIPYNYADHQFGRRLAGALRREGVSPWIDDFDMSAGVLLASRITHAVRPVDFVVPIISAASITSRWVEQELRTVAARDFHGRRVRVLPARIDGTALPEHMATQPYVDFHGRGWKQAYDDLKAVVQQRAGPRPDMRTTPGIAVPRPLRRTQPVKEKASRAKLLFLSYDYENDGYYKDVLLTWSKSPDFPRLIFNDQPVSVPVDSVEADPVKRQIEAKIKAATGFLCIVGTQTSTNGWVGWEIRTAIDLDRRMVVVRTSRDAVAPDVLSEMGATCALSFTFEGIKRAVGEAYGVVAAD